MSRILFAPMCLLLLSSLLAGQSANPAANPCAAMQQKQFDFWLGEWDLTWPGQNGGKAGHGANSVKRILDGCVVQETFSGADAMHLRGTSLSTFDARDGRWKQTWVDNEGGYLDFAGEFKNGQMILQRESARNGARLLQRMVWKNITQSEFDWSWEASPDGGKTWQVNWPIHYKRKK